MLPAQSWRARRSLFPPDYRHWLGRPDTRDRARSGSTASRSGHADARKACRESLRRKDAAKKAATNLAALVLANKERSSRFPKQRARRDCRAARAIRKRSFALD